MDSSAIARQAAEVLRRGGLVALPTETVYGLAGDAESELAVRRIFAVKGRPSAHPLIVHLADAAWLAEWAREIPAEARALAGAFWPGPLTLVLKRTPRALDAVTGGQDTVALRVPGHPLAREVLAAFGGGVAAPSANRFGGVSPTTAEHVRADLGAEVELIVDGGPCAVGVESTIVDLSSGAPAVLRPGGVPLEELGRVLGRPVAVRKQSDVRAPGTLASHYAPHAGVVLAKPADVLGRAEGLRAAGKKVAVLAPPRAGLPSGLGAFVVPADPAGFARALYARLREVDIAGYDVVVVELPPEEGLGVAVVDRLARAAAPRG
jgi:L-threonylcarbamoyladenylate synthase